MNLENEYERKQLSLQLKNEIDEFCVLTYNTGPRSHLGASEIGHNCSRYLWMKFRWLFYKVHDGSQYRLFQRGHFEEPRFRGYAEGIGFTIQEFDDAHKDEVDKGKKQIRIAACKGHFGGSVDGIGFRSDVGYVLAEWKTQGIGKQGKNFIKLEAEGVKKYKPVHWAQMSIYGYKLGLQYALYIAVNKTTDELHVEFVKLDWELGKDLEKKAEFIIFAETAPNGIGCSASYWECSYCDAKELCFSNAEPLVNCRSCKYSTPVDNSEWGCKHWNAVIPKDAIPNACPEWESIF